MMRGRKRLRKKRERALLIGEVYASLLEMLPGNRQILKHTMGRIPKRTKRAIISGFRAYCAWRSSVMKPLIPQPKVAKEGKRLDIVMYLAPDKATHQLLHAKLIPHQHC